MVQRTKQTRTTTHTIVTSGDITPTASEYEHLTSSDDLARMILAYFMAYALEAGLKEEPMRQVLTISPRTARAIGQPCFITAKTHKAWDIPMSFWLAVDEAGNAFRHGSEGWATHLTFRYLRKLPAQELKSMLEDCNPFDPTRTR